MKVIKTALAGIHDVKGLEYGRVYDVLEEAENGYHISTESGSEYYHKDWLKVVQEPCEECGDSRCIFDGPAGDPPSECEACFDQEPEEQPKPIDAHYTSFVYTLTEKDRKDGIIKIDPYFVSNQWQLGAKDNTGILFHCLKNIARFSDKNSKEREIIALFKQVKRLAELEKVNLEGQ